MATYAELLIDTCRFAGRDPDQDTDFADALPRIFDNAQRRIGREIDFSALHRETAIELFTPADALIPRPTDALTINYVEARYVGQTFKVLEHRPLAWLKSWRSFQTTRTLPRYVALYDHNDLYVTPIPDVGMEHRIGYRKLDALLGDTQETNYFSRTHPELLLSALLVEATNFKQEEREQNQTELAKWEASYQRQKQAAIANESMSGIGAVEIGTQVQQS